jgi:IPT/TIG domain
VTVTGTGFWSTANSPQFPVQIFFCPTGGGSCTKGSVLSVTGPPSGSTTDTLTALTPAVSASGNYYIQVESYNLTSALTSNVEFTYNVHVPLVISLSAASGATGSALTITGANFLTGSTVGFCPTANYSNNACNGSMTNATIASPITSTSITISVPAAASGNYYPIVTLPNGYLSAPFNASQAYNQPADTFAHT